MIYVIIIKHTKFSYSSIESQIIPCVPAGGYEFHALAVYLHPAFTAPFSIGGVFRIQSNICGGAFLREKSKSLDPLLFLQKSSIMDVWQDPRCGFVR